MRNHWPPTPRLGMGSKVFLFFIIIILISNVILYLFTTQVYARSQEQRAQQYNKDLIDQYIRSTDNYILTLDNIAHALMFNSTIQISLNDNRLRTQSDLFRERTYALDAIRLFEFGRSEIDISIFSQTDPFRFFTVNSNIAPAYDNRTDEWHVKLLKSLENKIIVYDNQQRYLAPSERRIVSTIAYKIWHVYTLENIGYLLIDIDMQYLKDLYDSPSTDINGLFIFSDEGKLIHQTNEITDPDLLFERAKTDKSAIFLVDYNGREEWAISGVSETTGWVIVNVSSREQVLREIRQANIIFMIIYASLFALASVVGYAYSQYLVRPLTKLTDALNKMKEGQFSTTAPLQINTRAGDEVGVLITSFNEMSTRIDDLLIKAQNEKLVRMESDYEALQQQINPHFLYNTLEMIMGMACLKETDNITQVCKSLADMFRYNLNGKRSVTVQEELMQVKNYLLILSLRCPNSFEVQYEIDSDVLHERTIKLILQPFVENAITHGFARHSRHGLLKIIIRRRGSNLYFAIRDTGQGMDVQVLEDLLSHMNRKNLSASQQPYAAGKYRGVINVYQRLWLTFSDRMTFHIYSQKNEGTSVEILVPPLNGIQ
jgi:two-component system, sensor histidine kinase YesM